MVLLLQCIGTNVFLSSAAFDMPSAYGSAYQKGFGVAGRLWDYPEQGPLYNKFVRG
jgi:hypothetical protein